MPFVPEVPTQLMVQAEQTISDLKAQPNDEEMDLLQAGSPAV